MATQRELVFNLLSVIRGGIITDDDPIPEDQIAFMIKYVRQTLLKRELDKKDKFQYPYSSEQSLDCLDVICTDLSECCDKKISIDTLRTKDKIPTLISNPRAVRYIGLIDGRRGFEYTYNIQVERGRYDRFTNKVPKVYLEDDYFYIANVKNIKKIKVIGIFEDPEEVFKINKCTSNCEYAFQDEQYPIESYLITELNRIIISGELRTLGLTVGDTKNNAKHEQLNINTNQ